MSKIRNPTVVSILRKLEQLGKESDVLHTQWANIKVNCDHKDLPKRRLDEEHMDTCPDCGFVAYAYMI